VVVVAGPVSVVLVVVLVLVVLDVELVVVAQPLAPQASQQLSKTPVHAPPPRGALQRSGARTIEHLVLPFACVRQHVAAPGRPHVEREAQRTTVLRQDGFASAADAADLAQAT
jgi:hypothetical protein